MLQQWIDLARYTGLQVSKSEESSCLQQARTSEELSFQQAQDASNAAALDCSSLEETNVNDEGDKK